MDNEKTLHVKRSQLEVIHFAALVCNVTLIFLFWISILFLNINFKLMQQDFTNRIEDMQRHQIDEITIGRSMQSDFNKMNMSMLDMNAKLRKIEGNLDETTNKKDGNNVQR